MRLRAAAVVVALAVTTACSSEPVWRVQDVAPAPVRASLAPGCHGTDCRGETARASRSRRLFPQTVDNPVGLVLKVTAYCSGTITASQKRVREGMVATLSRRIPFGTHVSIEGMGEYVVEDRIGHGSEVDIYMTSCARAWAFGKHYLHVHFDQN